MMFEPLRVRCGFACGPDVPKRLDGTAFLLMAGFLWVLPISHTVTIREVFFFSLLAVTLWTAWRHRLKLRLPLLGAWAFYAAVAVFSLSYALDPAYSFKEIKNDIVYSILVMLVSASWIRNNRSLSRLLWLIIIGNAFLVLVAVSLSGYLQIFYNSYLFSAPFDIGVGKFSTYIILLVPFIAAAMLSAVKKNPKTGLLLLLLLVFNLAALYFSGNRASWLSVLAELIIMFLLIWHYTELPVGKKTFYLSGFILLAAIAVLGLGSVAFQVKGKTIDEKIGSVRGGGLMKTKSESVRLEMWRLALKNIGDRPLSGGGYGRNAFKLLNPDFSRTHYLVEHAHNVFLDKGVQMGIPGILAFCLLLWSAFLELSHSFKDDHRGNSIIYAIAGISMLAGMIVKNITDDFFVRDVAWLFWLLMAAVIGAAGNNEDSLRKVDL